MLRNEKVDSKVIISQANLPELETMNTAPQSGWLAEGDSGRSHFGAAVVQVVNESTQPLVRLNQFQGELCTHVPK